MRTVPPGDRVAIIAIAIGARLGSTKSAGLISTVTITVMALAPKARRRALTRSFLNRSRNTRSLATKKEHTTVHSQYEETNIPGGGVDWHVKGKIVKQYRYPTVVRISRTKSKGEYYKSVHAKKTTPGGRMVGVYLGAVLDEGRIRDGRWCVAIPGHRSGICLDSKISKDWPWARYLREGAVGGFFNSSRKDPEVSNHRDANCELKWFFENRNINGGRVFAVLFTKRSVRRGEEFLWDYPWL